MAYQPVGLPPESSGGGSGSGGKDIQLMGNFAGIDTTCSSAATDYQVAAVPLKDLVEPNCRFGIRVVFSWAGLSASTKTGFIGYGRNFAAALAGGTSATDGRAMMTKTSTAANQEMDFTCFVDVTSNVDVQRLHQTSTGDENPGTSSANPTGAVLLSLNDSSIYFGVKSTQAGEIIKVEGIEVWKVKAK